MMQKDEMITVEQGPRLQVMSGHPSSSSLIRHQITLAMDLGLIFGRIVRNNWFLKSKLVGLN